MLAMLQTGKHHPECPAYRKENESSAWKPLQIAQAKLMARIERLEKATTQTIWLYTLIGWGLGFLMGLGVASLFTGK